MLILGKLLPLLVLPPGICILLAIAGLLLKRRFLLWISAGLLCVLSLPVVGDALMLSIEAPYHRIPLERVRKAEAVVVLSGMLQQIEGAPLGEFGEAADRFEGGIDLYKAGKAPLLVFTGGQMPWDTSCVPEGKLLTARARLRGVPASHIRLTAPVANTAEEALATANLLGASPGEPKRIILVTSAFHMQRALMLFRTAGFEVDPYPVDFLATDLKSWKSPFDLVPSAGAMNASSVALRELIGRAVYRFGMRFMMPTR